MGFKEMYQALAAWVYMPVMNFNSKKEVKVKKQNDAEEKKKREEAMLAKMGKYDMKQFRFDFGDEVITVWARDEKNAKRKAKNIHKKNNNNE